MEIDYRQLCDDVLALMGLLKNAISKIAEKHHLTMQQLYALYAISEGESTMGRLAVALHCDASNVTGIVDRLVARELITSKESTQDLRAKTLALKDGGQQILAGVIDELPKLFGGTSITLQEYEQFHRFISKIDASND
jgi:DNA-binding MarR family transcriptional regulator